MVPAPPVHDPDPMDETVTATIVAAAVVLLSLVVIACIVAARKERERRSRIARWAARRGWRVQLNPSVPWIRLLPGTHRRGVSLLVHGHLDGRTVAVADYSYTTTSSSTDSSGRSSTSTTTHHLVVTAVRLPHPYPAIAITRRGALSRLGRSMFGDGATATGVTEFDRRFRIRTRHPELVRPIFGPALIAEHLADSVPEWSIADHDLVAWRPGRITDPEQIPAIAARLVRVARHLASAPAHR